MFSKIIKAIQISILIFIIMNFAVYYWVAYATRDKLYSSIENIPYNKVGLLLGTGKILANGHINPYYQYRLNAAVALYKAKKISYILISGDNSHAKYNEPVDFKNDLLHEGVPPSAIYLDYAGFRTYDSILRAKEIFSLKKVTLISQKFHNERAIYIANNENIDAIAFNAKSVPMMHAIRATLREFLARNKMFFDFLINKKPKYLGEKITIK